MAAGFEIPEPLIARKTTVVITADSVVVNGQIRHLTTQSRALLEYILEHGGLVKAAQLQQEFFTQSTSVAAIKQIFRRFRQQLGWQDSLIVIDNLRYLDRRAIWQDLRGIDSDFAIVKKLEF